jgi:aspartate/methionine/tyrosine aminotransferase
MAVNGKCSKLKFDWGEPYCVREALKQYYKRQSIALVDIDNLGYTPDEGDKDLIDVTRDFIEATTGVRYKYVLITNGTTGGINVVLRCLARMEKKKICYTHKYFFPYYPDMITKNGYKHKKGLYKNHEAQLAEKNTVGLVDSPSNPEGDILLYTDNNNNIIWDSVYHNPVFVNSIPVKPDHRVNCGSYSKVFGLTGARIGWIATNSEEDYNSFVAENLHESCTISRPGQDLILDIFANIDLNSFMRSAKYRINNNREMFDRVSSLFDSQEVPDNGMFFSAWTNPYTQKLLKKLDITSVEMDKQGRDRFLRFNLAQTNEITKKAVRNILREDGI